MDFSHVVEPVTLTLLILLGVSLVALALYYGLIHFRVSRYQKGEVLPDATTDTSLGHRMPSVSVLLTAHNEADRLKDNLVYLLEQDYPDFEVVVVDYTSRDDTQFVLRVCRENYPNLKVVNFKEDVNMFKGEKLPLSIGIKEAEKEMLVFVTPECMPKEFTWLRELMSKCGNKTSIVLGYCGIRQEKGLLNAFQQYDNVTYSASYLGAALLGHPYTGSGRNLAYKRKFFFDQGAFISHYSVPEGADDLFVNQNADGKNTAVCITPNSVTQTHAKGNFSMWHDMRRSRTATRRYHPLGERLLRDLYPVNVLLFYACFALLLVLGTFPWQLVLGVLGMKLAWEMVSSVLLFKRFEIKRVGWFSPIFELYFLFANTFLAISPLNRRKY